MSNSNPTSQNKQSQTSKPTLDSLRKDTHTSTVINLNQNQHSENETFSDSKDKNNENNEAFFINNNSDNLKLNPKNTSINHNNISQDQKDESNSVFQENEKNIDTNLSQSVKLFYETRIETLEKELQESKNNWLKSLADFQNFQKQTDLDIAQTKKSAKKSAVLNLIGFLNTIYLSLYYSPSTEDSKVLAFINTLKSSFDKVLEDLKVQNIEILIPKVGESFDAEFMQVLNPGESASDVVVSQVVSLGVRIDGQVIQPVSIMI
jgi:molecular chaperone GrpE